VLPEDYLKAERKLNTIKSLYDSLLKLSINFTASDYEPEITDALKEQFKKVNEYVSNAPKSPTSTSSTNANNFALVLSASVADHANALVEDEPLKILLRKYAAAQERIGNAKVEFESEVYSKFTQPWQNTLKNNVSTALNAKKAVQQQKHALDMAKTKLKHSNDDKLLEAQRHLEECEQRFREALEDSMYKIRLVTDSPEPLRNLKELAQAQLKYSQSMSSILSEAVPEMEELEQTQMALFNAQ
jgi:hypothetical protein